jgi:hypothetical protein
MNEEYRFTPAPGTLSGMGQVHQILESKECAFKAGELPVADKRCRRELIG